MKNFIITCFAALTTLCVVSCGDNAEGGASLGPVTLSFEDVGSTPETYELTTPEVMSVKFSIVGDNAVSDMVSVSCKIDKDLVATYNEANGTSYLLAPADTYEMVADKAMMPRYNTRSSSITVSLFSEAILDAETYILPVRITSVDGPSTVSIDEENNVHYIIFKAKQQNWLDRSGWEFLFIDSEWGEKGGVYGDEEKMSGYAADMLDDDECTYWGYNFKLGESSWVPIDFVIDMKKEVEVDGVGVAARITTSGIPTKAPYTFKVWTATSITGDGMGDDKEWSYSEEFTELPNQLYNNVFLERSQTARYLRFTLIMSYHPSSGNPSYKGGTFAELRVAGNEIE